MVNYGRRTTFRKYGKYAKRKVYGKRKGVFKTGVRVLASKVRTLQREMKRKRVALYTINNQTNQSANLVAPYVIQKLCNFSNDGAIFGTDPNDLLGAKVLLKSISLKLDVQLENLSETEEETQHIEMYIVQLRDEANDIFSPVNGNISLTANIHYWQFGGVNGGYTYLNKKYFKVLKHKRFMLTNYGAGLNSSAGQTLDGTNFRYDCKIPVNAIIHANMSNSADQTWAGLQCPRDPSQNYYVLWFNDNSSLDGESPRANCLALKKFEKLDN